MDCVKLLLDSGAQVNMQDNVSDVSIHCVHVMQRVPRIPIVNEDMCTGTLFSACMPSN